MKIMESLCLGTNRTPSYEEQ